MRKLRFGLIVTGMFLSWSLIGCQAGSDTAAVTHQTFMPDQITWKENPPGLPPGAKMAVLDGDPSKPGFFTMRAWMPDGYRIPAHWHPNAERVTILSGTLYLGQGDRFEESGGHALTAGSYSAMPAGMRHYAWTKGETTIQLSSIGPWGITYVNPADDPRNAAK